MGDKTLTQTEEQRIASLDELRILDSAPTPEFDAVVELAREIFGVPLAFVCFVHRDRLWFKAGGEVKEMPRDSSICTHAVATGEPVVIEDTTLDLRSANLPYVVSEPKVRFYAGVPLIDAGGLSYGTLCVLDTRRRSFGTSELERLQALARIVMGLVRDHRSQIVLEEQHRELMLRQAQFQQTEKVAKVGGFEMDLVSGAIVWSDQVYRNVGLPIGMPMSSANILDCYAPEERERVSTRIRAAMRGEMGGVDNDYRILTPEGEERWVHIKSDVECVDGEPTRLFGIVQDITEQHRIRKQLEQAATTDPLTGLPNRAHFRALVERQIDAPRPGLGLLLIKIGNLKQVNETIGDGAGDILLKAAAHRLAGRWSVVCRRGGDEFTVVLEGQVSGRKMTSTAAQMIRLLSRPIRAAGQTVTPVVSIGGARFEPGATFESLNQKSNLALRAARRQGGGSFVQYDEYLHCSIARRSEKVAEVDRALLEGRMLPHYQPIVNTASGKIVRLEALARMRRENGDIVAAGQFHEALSDARIAHRLTTAMLDQVGHDIRRWLDAGIAIERVGINVSTADFLRGDLYARIAAAFGTHGVPLTMLLLEVTETVFMDGIESVVAATLDGLRDEGVIVALDDFGTGHASLTHLRTLPVDVIKIDRSFIGAMLEDNGCAAITEMVIGLGARLKMKVTAEGVECIAQAARLQELGCTHCQGYLYAAPMSADATAEMLARFGARRGKRDRFATWKAA